MDGYNESVSLVGSHTNIGLNDHSVLADGTVYSGDAKTALTASLLAEINSVSGYETLMKTLPGASEEKLKNSPAVAGQAACLSFGKCAWRFFGGVQNATRVCAAASRWPFGRLASLAASLWVDSLERRRNVLRFSRQVTPSAP